MVDEPGGGPDADLRSYLQLFKRRRGVVILTMLLVVASAVGSSLLQTPVYEGSARVLIRQQATDSLFGTQSAQTASQQSIQTEIELLKSEPVRAVVREKLGATPRFSVSQVGETDVIEIKAESTEPKQAAAIANAYATAYTDLRRKQTVDELVSAGREIQGRVTSLQREIDALGPPPTRDPARPVVDVQAERREVLLQQQALFKRKIDELQVDAALKTGGAQLVTPASVPTSPIRPTTTTNALLAAAVGLMLGIGFAFLFEYLDDSIKDKEELERASNGLPTLGLIPAVAGWKERKRPLLVSTSDAQSPAAEAYRSLRTSIQFMGLDRPLRSIQVTSANAGEGKTTTIANLGVALAQAGQRVVIVSCDLRRPRLHEFFGLSNGVGFTSVLLGDVPVSSALHPVEGVAGLSVVVSGPIPPNPSELLAGRRAVEALAALQAEADVVLLDSPPILPVTDAAVLANRVDGTLLVASAGKTTRRELHRAQEVLRQVDALLIGTLLNGVSGDAAYGYSYGYQYAYSESQPNGRKGRHSPAKI
ncbi:MAG TPA: polysaccharide biosynthesis tyrosine autokinase [Acidimicrobiales bacterium]|nr:polysaccharide biosynthesis tyrosine autokinase [Acidimicrobiales bacterium]